MAALVNDQIVMAKCDSFVDYQLLPLVEKLNPSAWLTNFKDSEKDLAVHLLNSFIYYSETFTDKLFSAAFLGLSRTIRPIHSSYLKNQTQWRDFLDTILVTHVTGEEPNTTDSGYTFARRARQVVGIEETYIIEPSLTIEQLFRNAPTPWPVVFVDDFVGSGNQFVETWYRKYNVSPTKTLSFADLA
jgi:hypothetical protein